MNEAVRWSQPCFSGPVSNHNQWAVVSWLEHVVNLWAHDPSVRALDAFVKGTALLRFRTPWQSHLTLDSTAVSLTGNHAGWTFPLIPKWNYWQQWAWLRWCTHCITRGGTSPAGSGTHRLLFRPECMREIFENPLRPDPDTDFSVIASWVELNVVDGALNQSEWEVFDKTKKMIGRWLSIVKCHRTRMFLGFECFKLWNGVSFCSVSDVFHHIPPFCWYDTEAHEYAEGY